jgi:hypothetical protein
MATLRAMDSSGTFNALALSNARVLSIDTVRGLIDNTVKLDLHAQRAPGLVTHTASFAGVLDYVTGQKDAIDRLEAATPSLTAATLIYTWSTGKTWTWTSGALMVGYRITSPEGDAVVTVEVDWHLNVPAVIAWA